MAIFINEDYQCCSTTVIAKAEYSIFLGWEGCYNVTFLYRSTDVLHCFKKTPSIIMLLKTVQNKIVCKKFISFCEFGWSRGSELRLMVSAYS